MPAPPAECQHLLHQVWALPLTYNLQAPTSIYFGRSPAERIGAEILSQACSWGSSSTLPLALAGTVCSPAWSKTKDKEAPMMAEIMMR
mmetsp:Transcript_37110/g.58624  ORF Transcript_37110/g.58624 Transcript_37110/m.58624 type:complete len:88 (-) Transcript_37110:377-640(-)